MDSLRRTVRAGRKLAQHPAPAEEAEQHASSCFALIDAGKYQTALEHARAGQQTWPENVRLVRAEARALAEMGRSDEAEHALKRLEGMVDDPDHLDPLRRTIARSRISRAEQEQDFDRALALVHEAQAAWPKVETFSRAEIRLLVQARRLEEALAALPRLGKIVSDPDDVSGLRYITQQALLRRAEARGDVNTAIAAVETALRASPRSELLHLLRIDILGALGRPAQLPMALRARRALRRTIRHLNKELQAHDACFALINAGEYQAALEQARAAQKTWPSSAGFIRAEARALAEMGQYEAALQVMPRLEALVPNPDELSSLRRTIHRAGIAQAQQRGDLEEALQRAREGRDLWPGIETFHRAEARILAQSGDPDAALDILPRLEKLVLYPVELDGLRQTIQRAKIVQAQDSGDWDESLSRAEAALQTWPEAMDFHRLKARILLWLGRGTEAFQQVEHLRALGDPPERTMSLVHDALRKQQAAFHEAGDFGPAIAAWFRMAAIYPEPLLSPNPLTDNLLAVLQTREQADSPAQDAKAVLEQLDLLCRYARAGDAGQVRAILTTLLTTLPSVDWLPRFLRLFHRDLDGNTGLTALAAVGQAMLDMETETSAKLFRSRPAEAIALITNFGRGEITKDHPDMVSRLADMFLEALGPSIEAYSLRARVNFQIENFQESQADIARALALDPYAFQALETEFLLLATAGRHDDVARRLDELKQARALPPESLARLAAKGQRTEDALELFREALDTTPDNRDLASAYIKFCFNEGFWGHCMTAFAQNTDLRKGHPQIAQDVEALAQAGGIDPDEIDRDPFRFKASPTAFRLAARERLAPAVQTGGQRPDGKRVAVVISSLGPGGAERQCAVLVRTIARDPQAYGISELKLFCTNLTTNERSRFLLEDIREAGLEPVEYFSRDRMSDYVPTSLAHMLPRSRAQVMVQLRQALQEFQPDTVHGILDETIINACLASLNLGGIRFVGRWGSLPPGSFRQVSQRARANTVYLQGAYRELIAQHPNAAFYSNATEAARAYETWLDQPEHSFSTIYNGIETDNFVFDPAARADIRHSLGIDPDTVVIGTAFRFTEEKRPFKWLDIAQAASRQAKSKLAFIMVGKGPLLLPAQEYAAQKNIDNVHFVGRQSEISKWWSAMDIGLMTSSVEGISNTVIEAQLLGRPVVAFDVGGMNEAIQTGLTGQLFADGRDGDMVDFLASLADEADRRNTMARAGTAFVMERFSAETLARNTAALY